MFSATSLSFARDMMTQARESGHSCGVTCDYRVLPYLRPMGRWVHHHAELGLDEITGLLIGCSISGEVAQRVDYNARRLCRRVASGWQGAVD